MAFSHACGIFFTNRMFMFISVLFNNISNIVNVLRVCKIMYINNLHIEQTSITARASISSLLLLNRNNFYTMWQVINYTLFLMCTLAAFFFRYVKKKSITNRGRREEKQINSSLYWFCVYQYIPTRVIRYVVIPHVITEYVKDPVHAFVYTCLLELSFITFMFIFRKHIIIHTEKRFFIVFFTYVICIMTFISFEYIFLIPFLVCADLLLNTNVTKMLHLTNIPGNAIISHEIAECVLGIISSYACVGIIEDKHRFLLLLLVLSSSSIVFVLISKTRFFY